jgi:hypothetical protein
MKDTSFPEERAYRKAIKDASQAYARTMQSQYVRSEARYAAHLAWDVRWMELQNAAQELYKRSVAAAKEAYEEAKKASK